MKPHRPHTSRRAHSDLLREIRSLERCGRFDDALQELRGVWDDTTKEPDTTDLDARLAAETYLRCGALIGFVGHIRLIPTAQERSKNLLTEARSRFLEIYDPEKIAECDNYIALAYWRTGETNEAISWIEDAASHRLSEGCDTQLYSFVIRDLIYLSQKRFLDVCSNFAAIKHLYTTDTHPFLTGSIYNNFGLASKNLGDTATAQVAMKKARDLFTASGHKLQIALTENNLSTVYKIERKFDQAHAAVDRSISLYQEIKDRTREGFTLDTKALIFFDEGRFAEALETVERAISILGKSENYAYLSETLLTKARVQLYTDDFSTATLTLLEAVELAKVRISEEAAMNLVREFETTLRDRNSGKGPANHDSDRSGIATGDLKLVLPAALARYDDFQGVWITNSDLESCGLNRGSLAVVVPASVRRGDLVALVEVENDQVSCGLFDKDFGIVCLEAGTSEPQLFNESDVRILGKIVGVCDPNPSEDGTMKVQALDL
jgi:tetratricopeptide (TPR) repeat protein